jgi:hypothetical protein
MDYEIIDNFLPEKYYKTLKRKFIEQTEQFPWYYSADQVGGDSSYFYHVLFAFSREKSDYYEDFYGIVDRLKPNALIQMRLNLLVNVGVASVSDKHKDEYTTDMKHRTGILYFGTNNGKTVLCGEDYEVEIDSVDNRFLSFDSNIEHYAKRQTDKDRRIVLNVNWYHHGVPLQLLK